MRPQSKVTDLFTDLKTFYSKTREIKLKFNTAEIMVHPASENNEEEMTILNSDWRLNLPFETKLISFYDL